MILINNITHQIEEMIRWATIHGVVIGWNNKMSRGVKNEIEEVLIGDDVEESKNEIDLFLSQGISRMCDYKRWKKDWNR